MPTLLGNRGYVANCASPWKGTDKFLHDIRVRIFISCMHTHRSTSRCHLSFSPNPRRKNFILFRTQSRFTQKTPENILLHSARAASGKWHDVSFLSGNPDLTHRIIGGKKTPRC